MVAIRWSTSTNVFVDFLQGPSDVVDRLEVFFESLKQRPGASATSELTYAELKGKEAPSLVWETQKKYYFGLLRINSFIDLRPVSFDILAETGDLRRSAQAHGRQLKLADAIHLATAIHAACRYFLTSDRRICMLPDLEIIRPDATGLKMIESLLDA